MAEDKFETLKKMYTSQTSAEALFFSARVKAFRLEVPDIGIEFTDGAYIGTDPSGVLYYNYRHHFDTVDQVNYKVIREVNPFDGKVLAHIKFFSDTEDLCHAEFLAYDPQETVNGASMNGYINRGYWQDLTLGSVTATVQKFDDQQTVHITVGPLGKQAKWLDHEKFTGKELLHDKAINVKGTLHFKDLNTVANGRYANYSNDRIVFYENDWCGKDFVAFFIPFETSPGTLGVPASANAIYQNLVWS